MRAGARVGKPVSAKITTLHTGCFFLFLIYLTPLSAVQVQFRMIKGTVNEDGKDVKGTGHGIFKVGPSIFLQWRNKTMKNSE